MKKKVLWLGFFIIIFVIMYSMTIPKEQIGVACGMYRKGSIEQPFCNEIFSSAESCDKTKLDVPRWYLSPGTCKITIYYQASP